MSENRHIDEIMQELTATDSEGGAMQSLLSDNGGFSEGFSERTTAAAFAQNEEGLAANLSKAFRWVALLGTAAAVALLILTWTANDSLTTDDIAGVSALSLTDPIAENLY